MAAIKKGFIWLDIIFNVKKLSPETIIAKNIR